MKIGTQVAVAAGTFTLISVFYAFCF